MEVCLKDWGQRKKMGTLHALFAWIASREAMKSESCPTVVLCFTRTAWTHGWMRVRLHALCVDPFCFQAPAKAEKLKQHPTHLIYNMTLN
ncbi:hypothetical protein CK203_088046 [Vitis vinifera]|uniref:Uncharacterized protein n=1 Tax=Vitis vinifera TaxID=29760 RepID=A0A438DBS3_VITVI|nr:hypothetical protein CK203_088046 [Vitis vinifera]